MLKDPNPMYAMAHVTATTTYHEGLSTICIKSEACARPVIGTDIYGIRETIANGITGFLVKPGNVEDFIEKIILFHKLTLEQRCSMGQSARRKVEKEFDRRMVVDRYKSVIDEFITNKI